MSYSQITPIAGQVQQGYVNSVDVIQRAPLGAIIQAVDNYYGLGEFVYVAFPATTTITQGQVLVLSGFGGAAGYQAAVATAAANTGRPIYIAINSVASSPSVQYGWVMRSGNAVIKTTASVAAGTTFGIDAATAGSVAANSAGRQVLNAVSIAPSTTAIVKTWQLKNGSPVATTTNLDGLVPGLALSGTGVSGTIVSIDYDGRTITMSANASAGGSSTITATYTGFIVGQIDRPCLQGAIT